MEVRHLRYFLTVAEELHFRRAAERLHMAQPPLSARIKDLEQELGTPLFERTRQGVALTEAGRALLPMAREAVERFDLVVRFTKGDGFTQRSNIRVGITPDTTPPAIESFTTSVQEAIPDLSLEIVEAHTAQQIDQLRRGDLDLGLLRHPFATNGLHVSPPLSTPVGALMASTHPLASQDFVAPQDLADYPIVLFPREAAPAHYDELISALAAHGLQNATLRHALRILHALLFTEQAVALRNVGTIYRDDAQQEIVWRPMSGEFLRWYTSVSWPVASQHPWTGTCADALVDALVTHDNWVRSEPSVAHLTQDNVAT